MTIDATFLRLQSDSANAERAKISIEIPPEVFEFMKTQASRGEYVAYIPCTTTMGFPSREDSDLLHLFVDVVSEKLEGLGFFTRKLDLLVGNMSLFVDWTERRK